MSAAASGASRGRRAILGVTGENREAGKLGALGKGSVVGRRHMPVGLSVLVLAVTFGLASCSPPKPNIVVVMTDDQTAESIRFMPNVQELLGEEGTTFTNHLVSYSLCCPSRSTFLTGQYAHNHGVQGNDPPHGGYAKLDHTNTLPVWLQRAGYTTTLVGKYLNGYGVTDPNERPPGWDDWYALVGKSAYHPYDYQMNRNGEISSTAPPRRTTRPMSSPTTRWTPSTGGPRARRRSSCG